MALDFHIGEWRRFEPDFEPDAVSIQLGAHCRLLDLAASVRAEQLRRPPDFYEDAVFSPDQLPTLLADIDRVLPSAADDSELVGFLRHLRDLASDALARGRGVVALAD